MPPAGRTWSGKGWGKFFKRDNPEGVVEPDALEAGIADRIRASPNRDIAFYARGGLLPFSNAQLDALGVAVDADIGDREGAVRGPGARRDRPADVLPLLDPKNAMMPLEAANVGNREIGPAQGGAGGMKSPARYRPSRIRRARCLSWSAPG